MPLKKIVCSMVVYSEKNSMVVCTKKIIGEYVVWTEEYVVWRKCILGYMYTSSSRKEYQYKRKTQRYMFIFLAYKLCARKGCIFYLVYSRFFEEWNGKLPLVVVCVYVQETRIRDFFSSEIKQSYILFFEPKVIIYILPKSM